MHSIDPDHLPRHEGTLDRFLINPHGKIAGFLLADGIEVHVPPHLGGAVREAVRLGAAITVSGLRPRGSRTGDRRSRSGSMIALAHANWTPPERHADGSDRDRIGGWPAKGLLDSQLGPNRNGPKW